MVQVIVAVAPVSARRPESVTCWSVASTMSRRSHQLGCCGHAAVDDVDALQRLHRAEAELGAVQHAGEDGLGAAAECAGDERRGRDALSESP